MKGLRIQPNVKDITMAPQRKGARLIAQQKGITFQLIPVETVHNWITNNMWTPHLREVKP
jgi:hypothetical protein